LRSKTDRSEAAKSLYTAIQAIELIEDHFAPFLPETSEETCTKTLATKHHYLANLLLRPLLTRSDHTLVLGLDNENSLAKEGSDSGLQQCWRLADLSINRQPCSKNLTTASLKKNARD
jgi:hypothetical protein